MDVSFTEGGGIKTRKRRGRRAAAAQEGGNDATAGEWTATVEKVAATPATSGTQLAPIQTGSGLGHGNAGLGHGQSKPKAPAVVVLAPAKKKMAKVMLVPKGKSSHRTLKRVFKAKRVHMTVDHSAKTQKRRRQLVQRIDTMTDEQLRSATVAAQLSRRESVALTPTPLLRQMLRDYQTMKGMLL